MNIVIKHSDWFNITFPLWQKAVADYRKIRIGLHPELLSILKIGEPKVMPFFGVNLFR
jgi:hypothetical protein